MNEAIQADLIHSFSVNRAEEINLHHLPPAIAEAYVFTMVETLKYRCRKEHYCKHEIVFKVSPFEPRKALLPSSDPSEVLKMRSDSQVLLWDPIHSPPNQMLRDQSRNLTA